MILFDSCSKCGKSFQKKRLNHRFCSRICVDKYRNDAKPRKTDKNYMLADQKKKERIPQYQLDIIRGTLMGDGSLTRQTDGFHRLSICHSLAQLDYEEYLRITLDSIFICSKCATNETQASIHSISHPMLSNEYGMLYRDGTKTITRRFLNLLTPTSILFWFLDDGSRIKSSGNSFVLCTDGFSISENRAITYWLWQKFRIEAFILEIHHRKGVGFATEDKTYYRIRFRRNGSEKLFRLMASSIFFKDVPKCLLYKFETYI